MKKIVLLIGVVVTLGACSSIENSIVNNDMIKARKIADSKKSGEKEIAYKTIGDFYFKEGDYKKALEYYELFDGKDEMERVAKLYAIGGEYKKSYLVYKKIEESESKIELILGDAALNNEEYDIARHYYSKSKNIEHLKKLGELFFIEKNSKEALELFLDIKYKEGIRRVGELYFLQKKYEEAAKVFKILEDKKMLKEIADLYFVLGKYEEAGKYYKELEMNSQLIEIGEIYLYKGEYENARKYYFFSGMGDWTINKKIADRLYIKQEYENAFNLYSKISDSKGMVAIGDEYFLRADYDKSAFAYSRANSKRGQERVISYFLKIKKYDKAKELLENLKADDLLLNLGKLAILEDREEEVERIFSLLKDLKGYEMVAKYFLDKKDYARVVEYYEKSGVLDKKSASKYVANLLLDEREYEKSMYYFKEALNHEMAAYSGALYLIDFYIHSENIYKDKKFYREIEKMEKIVSKKLIKKALKNEIVSNERVLNIYYADRGDRVYGNGDFLDLYRRSSNFYKSLKKAYRSYYEEDITSLKSDMFKVGNYITLLGGVEGYSAPGDKKSKYIIKDSYSGKIVDIVEKNGISYVKVGSRYYYKIVEGKFKF